MGKQETVEEREERLHQEAWDKRMATSCAMPMQPIEWDEEGVIRFKANRIVRWLLDAGPFDMNQIAMLPGITADERSQFAQLIGYSVSGYGDPKHQCQKSDCPETFLLRPLTVKEIRESVALMRRRLGSGNGHQLHHAACRLSLRMSEFLLARIDELETSVDPQLKGESNLNPFGPDRDWVNAILGLLKTFPEYDQLRWGNVGDRSKEGWGFCFELIKVLAKPEAERRAIVAANRQETP